MEKKKQPQPLDARTPSAEPVMGEPVDTWDQVNKYGTYEIQDTTETDNVFPLIGPLGAGISGVTLPDIPGLEPEEPPAKKP